MFALENKEISLKILMEILERNLKSLDNNNLLNHKYFSL